MKKKTAKVERPVYKAAAPRRVDAAFMKSFEWPAGADGIAIDMKAPVPLAKLQSVACPPGHSLRLGCHSDGKGVKYAVKNVPAAGIETRPPKNFSELKRVHALARNSYYKTWAGRMYKNFKKDMSGYEKDLLAKTNSLIVLKGGRPAGLFSLCDGKQKGKPFNLVAWHNLLPGLSAAERRSAFHQAALWMRECSDRPYAVGLDGFDKASIAFFAGLGFKVWRIGFAYLR